MLRAWPYTFLLGLCLVGLAARADSTVREISVLRFHGDSAWEVSETINLRTPSGRYATQKITPHFSRSSDACGDLLSRSQRPALEAMLKDRYITPELFATLSNPTQRRHKLSQYIIARASEVMTVAEFHRRGLSHDQVVEDHELGKSFGKVRVVTGSLFFVLGYGLERTPNDQGFAVVPETLPVSVGRLPQSLRYPLDRKLLRNAVEIGRAWVMSGAPGDQFVEMLRTLVATLAADAEALDLDPQTLALFGHGFDAEHIRWFSKVAPMRPLTPEMQVELEADPREFLTHYLEKPRPTANDWDQFADGIVVGSLAEMKRKFPPAALSDFVEQLHRELPSLSLTGDQALSMLRQLAAENRRDFDFRGHEEGRAGRRAPLQVRDIGTPLHRFRQSRVLERFNVDPALLFKILKLAGERLKGEPDFGQAEWLEAGILIPYAQNLLELADPTATIVVSNLDPQLKSAELAEYLGSVLLALSNEISSALIPHSFFEMTVLYAIIQADRQLHGLSEIDPSAALTAAAYLDTIPLIFASSDGTINRELAILGGTMTRGVRVVAPRADVDLGVLSPEGLEGLFTGPQPAGTSLFGAMLGTLGSVLADAVSNTLKPATVYRFKKDEVDEQREELPGVAAQPPDQILRPSLHRKKILRFYDPLI